MNHFQERNFKLSLIEIIIIIISHFYYVFLYLDLLQLMADNADIMLYVEFGILEWNILFL